MRTMMASRTLRAVLSPGLCLSVLATLGCTATLPNVRPFADGTAALYQANDRESAAVLSMYDETIDLTRDILRQSEVRLPPDRRGQIEQIQRDLRGNKRDYAKFARNFDAILEQAVAYSERIAELAAAGNTGAEAAQSLAGSINQFGELAGAGGLITGPVATILTRVAEHHTRMQASKSLGEAALAAQPAVEGVAEALEQIYNDSLQMLVTGLAAHHDQLLLDQAGASILGYYREANDRRDRFYRGALAALQRNDDGLSGFCRDPDTGAVDPDCITLSEMQALAEVEARLAALEPEFKAYESKRSELRAWRSKRRANGARIVRAVNKWARQHSSVVDALDSGAGVSALSLIAIIAEIQSSE